MSDGNGKSEIKIVCPFGAEFVSLHDKADSNMALLEAIDDNVKEQAVALRSLVSMKESIAGMEKHTGVMAYAAKGFMYSFIFLVASVCIAFVVVISAITDTSFTAKRNKDESSISIGAPNNRSGVSVEK